MKEYLCRLCLSEDNLRPIFTDIDKCNRYSIVLALTTGLQIKPNDGLPQLLCSDCIQSVNSALKFRNRSHLTEIKLVTLGYERRKPDNIAEKLNLTNTNVENNDFPENSSQDCFAFDGFKIQVELNRLTEDDGEKESKEAKVAIEKPRKKSTKNKKRAMYLKMVDGVLDPKGPVKCKICKKTVSKWACFINHVKKHLGFKFVCEFCGKSFITSTQLKRHCRSHHGMPRELKCKQCSYLALDNAQLAVHVRRAHTGDRPYVCDTCAASYFSRKCLVQHIESHRTTASVQCDKCPRLLKSARHLAKHRYGAHGPGRRERTRRAHDFLQPDSHVHRNYMS